jgi:two-component system cell cycle sensor histidine kinase/response regulator CckA
LVKRVIPLHPEMKVLYTSAYTEDIIGHRGVFHEGAQFIQKPFTLTALFQKVGQALDYPPTKY